MPRKPATLPKIQVIMDYKTLQNLLASATEVDSLRDEVKYLRQQISALRLQFTELMVLFREYKD